MSNFLQKHWILWNLPYKNLLHF